MALLTDEFATLVTLLEIALNNDFGFFLCFFDDGAATGAAAAVSSVP